MTLSNETRALVRRRADERCEYCLLPQVASIASHQIDHIIGKQHRGDDQPDNLCLSCIRCNLKKGPNIASIDPLSGDTVPLYHPRRQRWDDHFNIDENGQISGNTAEARATVTLLDMNHADRLRLRQLLLRQLRVNE